MGGADPDQWRKLLDAANGGQLALDPEVGRGLDKVCDDYLAQLDGILRTVQQVKVVSGFGPFPSGKILEKKFEAKATGSDRAVDKIILDHIDSVKTAKEVVAKAISNFVELDRQHGQQIAQTGPQ